MEIQYSLPEKIEDPPPAILTIGNFDGVHVGHQALLQRLKEIAREKSLKTTVVSFLNHPFTILRPNAVAPLLCTHSHKVKLIREMGVDTLVLLKFTKELSKLSAEQFLMNLKSAFAFDYLLLGNDAHIGKDRQGDKAAVTALGRQMNFGVEYFPDFTFEGQRVSSSQIRALILQGDLKRASQLLGRPYSIMATVFKEHGKMCLLPDSLCLPPPGEYAIEVQYAGKTYQGTAKLKVRSINAPVVELNILGQDESLHGALVDVVFVAQASAQCH